MDEESAPMTPRANHEGGQDKGQEEQQGQPGQGQQPGGPEQEEEEPGVVQEGWIPKCMENTVFHHLHYIKKIKFLIRNHESILLDVSIYNLSSNFIWII